MPDVNRINSDPDAIIPALKDLLRTTLSLPDEAVYETANPSQVPQIPHGGDYYFSVCDAGGQFDQGMYAAGGRNQLVQSLQLAVTGYALATLDKPDEAEMIRKVGNILAKKILNALVEQDLFDDNGNALLRNPLWSTGVNQAAYDQESGIVLKTVMVIAEYDYDLC